MIDTKEFFQLFGPLSDDAPSYIERDADSELIAALEQQELCLVFGPRQMGKTSLMVHALRRLQQDGKQTGIVDLQRLGSGQTLESFFGSIINQISRSLHLNSDSKKWFESNIHLSPTERFANFIEDIVLDGDNNDEKSQVVLFFDEIESILKLSFSDDFFTTVRSLFNARSMNPKLQRLTFVFLGTTTKSELIKDLSRTPFNIGKEIFLRDFARGQTAAFKKVLGEDSDQLIDRIFYWTNGQPLLVQNLAAAAYSWEPSERTNERLDLEVTELYLRKKIEQDTHLTFINNYLTTEYRKRKKALKIYLNVLKGKTIEEDRHSAAQDRLKLAGVVRVENGSLVSRNLIYKTIFNEKWVRENSPSEPIKIIGYTAAVLSILSLLWILALQPLLLPQFTTIGSMTKYTPDPIVEIQLSVKNSPRAYLDEKEILVPRDGVIHTSLGNLPNGESKHELKLVGGLFSRTYRIPITVAYYPRWQVRQFPDARLDTIGPILKINDKVIDIIDVSNGATLDTLTSTARIECAFWSPHHDIVVAGNRDGTLVRWIVGNMTIAGRVIGSKKDSFSHGHVGPVMSLAFAPRDNTFASGGGDHTIVLWDAEKRKIIQKLIGHNGPVVSLAFSPDGKTLVSASEDGAIKLWSLDGSLLWSVTDQNNVALSLAFSPDGRTFVSGSNDHTVKLWESATGKTIQSLSGHNGSVSLVVFSPDGKLMMSGSNDQTVRVWNVDHLGNSVTFNTFADLLTAQFSSDGRLVMAQNNTGIVRVWDIASREELPAFSGHKRSVSRVDFLPEGKRFLSGDSAGGVSLWSVDDGQLLHVFNNSISARIDSSDEYARDPHRFYLIENLGLVSQREPKRSLQLWDVGTQELLASFDLISDSDKDPIVSIGGKKILIAEKNGLMRIWDCVTGQLLHTLPTVPSVVQIELSPDGNNILFAESKNDLKLLATGSGKVLNIPLYRSTSERFGRAFLAMFSNDGKKLLIDSKDNAMELLDVLTGQPIQTFPHEKEFWAAGFSEDEKFVYGWERGGGGSIFVWDMKSGSLVKKFDVSNSSSTWFPNVGGDLIVTENSENVLKAWNLITGDKLGTFSDNGSEETALAFSPDNKKLLTIHAGDLKLWDIRSSRLLRIFAADRLRGAPGDKIAEFSPDGRFILSGGADGKIKLWWAGVDAG